MEELKRFKLIKKGELTTTSFVLKFEEEEGKITPSGMTWKIEEEDGRSFNEGLRRYLRRYDGTGVCWILLLYFVVFLDLCTQGLIVSMLKGII